ncbi:hypothetical protein Plhal703r1_c62g0166631 [Plasmopara halstedii]
MRTLFLELSCEWRNYLKLFEELIEGDFDWTLVIFANVYQLTPTATKLYGGVAIQGFLTLFEVMCHMATSKRKAVQL